MITTPFTYEPDLLGKFRAVRQEIYASLSPAQTPHGIAEEALLALPQMLEGRYHHRNFILSDGAQYVGRITAMLPFESEGQSAQVGMLGFFDCIDDQASADQLLDSGNKWLRNLGARKIVAPMNFSTWFNYRLATRVISHISFNQEPTNPTYYEALLLGNGFKPFKSYCSLMIPHTPVELLRHSAASCQRRGLKFKEVTQDNLPGLLPQIYDFARLTFQDRETYTYIDYSLFEQLYANIGRLIRSRLSWVAYSPKQEMVGFVLAYPLELAMEIGKQISSDDKITIVKTIAIDPSYRYLGWALLHQHIEESIDQGFTHGLYALMEKWGPLLKYTTDPRRMLGGELGRIIKEYTLFQK